MVANALIYHPTVSHYLKFVATTVGRDKVLRTIQYFARFYAWYLYRTNNLASTVLPWTTAKTQLGFVRKALRLGKSVEHVRLAATSYDTQLSASASLGDQFLRYCTIGRQLGYAAYLGFDNLGFLDTAGIMRSENAKEWARKASQAWMVGLAFSVAAGVWKRMVVEQRRRKLLVERGFSGGAEGEGEKVKDGEGKLEVKKLERERAQVDLQLLSDICDLTIPAFALGYGGSLLDDGLVGIAGTFSSVIGVMTQWQKTA